MDAKTFLRQLKKLDCMISNKLIEIEQWKSIAVGVVAPMGDERVQTSGSKQKMADAVIRYVDLEQEINEDIDRLVDAKRDVIRVIEQLPVEDYDLLHKHYVQYIELVDISVMYKRSYNGVKEQHKRAIKRVQAILNSREEQGENVIKCTCCY